MPRKSPFSSDHSAKRFVDQTFAEIQAATAVECLRRLTTESDILSAHAMPESKYPKIEFSLTPEELEQLYETRVLDRNNRISGPLFDAELSPLEKILYAVVWKNGDLGKEKSIIDGVLADPADELPESGIVFHQLGRHLRSRAEPIIDQHVIRAFAIYDTDETAGKQLKRYRRLAILGSRHRSLVHRYKAWLESSSLSPGLTRHSEYRFEVDKVLFALGRAVKAG